MASNKKPRKPYKPRMAGLPVTIRHHSDDERKLQLIPHQHLENLAQGIESEQAFHTIACRLNIGLTLAQNFGDDTQDEMRSAISAAIAIKERFERVGKYGASTGELMIIGRGLSVTDELQLACTRRETRDALRKVFAEASV